MADNLLLSPMLKWVGGKRQLLSEIVPMIDNKCSTYVEPFVGGGAVLFRLQPQKAIINDYNQELINVYRTVRDHLDDLIEVLQIHATKNTSDYYYEVRALDREDSFKKMSDIEKYEEIPELTESVNKMDYVEFPEYETIDINNISSEANAINVLILSGILDDFLDDDGTVETFNGRMGTGTFDFVVDTARGKKQQISVKNAQCEIDGGFENDNNVIIMEAKNVLNKDFHIRQLYYPYRLWKKKIDKPIRLVFSVYSNMIFRLFEYRFRDENDYSSIELVQTKNYSLQDTTIEIGDLIEVRKNTKVCFKDDQDHDLKVPFIQANSFERVISLLENLKDNPMTTEQIADFMEFDERQSDYYYNAGAYIGVFKKKKDDKQKKVFLTRLGETVFSLNYKPQIAITS